MHNGKELWTQPKSIGLNELKRRNCSSQTIASQSFSKKALCEKLIPLAPTWSAPGALLTEHASHRGGHVATKLRLGFYSRRAFERLVAGLSERKHSKLL